MGYTIVRQTYVKNAEDLTVGYPWIVILASNEGLRRAKDKSGQIEFMEFEAMIKSLIGRETMSELPDDQNGAPQIWEDKIR